MAVLELDYTSGSGGDEANWTGTNCDVVDTTTALQVYKPGTSDATAARPVSGLTAGRKYSVAITLANGAEGWTLTFGDGSREIDNDGTTTVTGTVSDTTEDLIISKDDAPDGDWLNITGIAVTAVAVSPLQVWDGTEAQDAEVEGVWDGTNTVPVDSWGVMPYGYQSRDAMLADAPFEIAHRGGSGSWPEMSMLAYANSVAHGMKALEFSVARTADNVLFGLHDTTLDRTSSNATGGINARDLTWQQIQETYRIDNLSGYSEPYVKLTDFLDAYAGTHLLFIDPKSLYGTWLQQLWDTLSQYGTANMVMKQFYAGTDYAAAAHAIGMKTWGYYYESDLENVGSTVAAWDYLGMDYTASQSAFDFMAQYNKPLIAHILPSAASKTTALAKLAGAKASGIPIGLMESGVKQIHPESV